MLAFGVKYPCYRGFLLCTFTIVSRPAIVMLTVDIASVGNVSVLSQICWLKSDIARQAIDTCGTRSHTSTLLAILSKQSTFTSAADRPCIC
jgi:hypothetical protein